MRHRTSKMKNFKKKLQTAEVLDYTNIVQHEIKSFLGFLYTLKSLLLIYFLYKANITPPTH